jgi:hypothetical protein
MKLFTFGQYRILRLTTLTPKGTKSRDKRLHHKLPNATPSVWGNPTGIHAETAHIPTNSFVNQSANMLPCLIKTFDTH